MKHILKFFLLIQVVHGVAQTSDTVATDSAGQRLELMTEQLEKYERLLRQNENKRVQDSLARMDLMKRIQLLQESDKVAQSRLKDQIREIEVRDSIRQAEQRRKIDELKAINSGFPVTPYKDTLFTIYSKLGTVKALDRAANVSEKIEILIRDDDFFSDSLIVEENDGTVDIIYRNLIVTSVSEWDALWADMGSTYELASNYRDTIATYITSNRNRSSVKNVMARIGLVFLILGGTLLVMYFLNKLATGLRGWMVLNKEKFFTGIRLGNYEFLPPSRHLDVALRSVGVFKWAAYALVFYLSLPIIFGLFPFTKGWANLLLNWILSPIKNIWLGFWDYLPNFFTIAVVFIITYYLVKFLRFVAREIELGNLKVPGFHEDWALPTFRLVKFLVYCFMIVVIYPYLPNSQSDVFKGVSIFIGLLISLGSSSAIANAVAGLVITYMRPFRIGDRVKIGNVSGEIIEKTLLVTRIRTIKNEDITVPNATVLSGHTVNYSSSSQTLGLILNTSVTIGYDVPWRKVHELLIEAAVATDGVNITREPFVLQTSLDDFYVAYQLNAYTDIPERMAMIYSDLHANIQDKFQEADIEIMSPHYRAERDGNPTTIPAKDQK